MARKSVRWSPASIAASSGGIVVAVAAPVPAAGSKQSKYRNTKVNIGGMTFDSKGEHARYVELAQLQACGEIADLKRSVDFVLAPSCHLGGKSKKPALRYRADFTYVESGAPVVEDFKSAITRKNPVYRIKKHLMMTVHGILIRESGK